MGGYRSKKPIFRKGNGNTAILLYSLKQHDILYQERREQVNTLVMAFSSRISDLQINSIPQSIKLLALSEILVRNYLLKTFKNIADDPIIEQKVKKI